MAKGSAQAADGSTPSPYLPHDRTAIGIDIGGTHLRAARIAADGRILNRVQEATVRDARAVLDTCLRMVASLRERGDDCLGIGVPGQVNAETGHIQSGGFVDLTGLDFAARMQAGTGLPVTIENDGTMALIAEAAIGAARGCASAAILTIGTGIGGAVIDRGRILRGRGVAGELGHIIVNPLGHTCVCGRRGCVETESSGTSFARHLSEAGLPKGTRAEDLLARAGDPVAGAVIAAWARPMRAVLDSLTAICNPDIIVIGGGAGPAMLAALERVPPLPSWYSVRVAGAELGEDAGVIGAGLAALGLAEARR
jgi:glucokinase